MMQLVRPDDLGRDVQVRVSGEWITGRVIGVGIGVAFLAELDPIDGYPRATVAVQQAAVYAIRRPWADGDDDPDLLIRAGAEGAARIEHDPSPI